MIKARLVGQEFADSTMRGELFAGTPGLPALRYLISKLATVSPGREKMSLAILDIKSAFLYGKARRKIAIELPPEDPRRDSGANVGLLNKSTYGTRDAPMIWQDHLRGVLTAMGFKESLSVPCTFRHPETNVNIEVRVDDIFAVGDEADLKWMIEQLKKQYDLKNKIIGPNEHQEKCASYLGRVISFTSAGVMMEPDKKHVETLLKEAGMESCKSSPTPFITENAILEHLRDEQREFMDAESARRHRGAVARVVCLAQDRPDLDVVACEMAKTMANPRVGDEALIKKVCRCPRGRPNFCQLYRYQNKEDVMILQSDSDWGNCRSTRRSNSGGLIMLGTHLLSHWCRVQGQIALGSGEAELYSNIRGIQELLFVKNIIEEDAGKGALSLVSKVDASACKGILLRHGVVKLKHLSLKCMGVQEAIRNEQVQVVKIPRDSNAADVLASASGVTDFAKHIHGMGGCWTAVDN